MAKKKSIEKPTCCFEWYDKIGKRMRACVMPAAILYRGKPLCVMCASHIDKSNTMVEIIK